MADLLRSIRLACKMRLNISQANYQLRRPSRMFTFYTLVTQDARMLTLCESFCWYRFGQKGYT